MSSGSYLGLIESSRIASGSSMEFMWLVLAYAKPIMIRKNRNFGEMKQMRFHKYGSWLIIQLLFVSYYLR